MLSPHHPPKSGRPAVATHKTIDFCKAVLRGDLGQVYLASRDPGVRSSLAYRIVETLTDKQHGAKYRLRVVHCPPPHLLWIMRGRAETTAGFIHRAYCRALWNERGFLGRLQLSAWYLAWPLIFALTSIWATVLNGRAIARRTGKPIARQVAEQVIVAWRFGCLPPSYYMFELFDEQRLARGRDYLHRFELKGGIYRLMKSGMKSGAAARMAPGLGNKNEFTEWCKANNLPVPENHLIHRAGDPIATLKPPPGDLFIKPLRETGGTGAEAWLHVAAGQYRSLLDGECLAEVDLFERIKRRNEDVLVQTRLLNHDAIRDLSNGALMTVRLITFLNETGAYEATHAGLRMAIGANRLVDNSHAGGIIAAVDMKSGRLGPATDIGLRPNIGWCTHHPDTGAVIEGRVLPLWPETVALACRAHAAFAPRMIVGWDIAITSDGPTLIEGNGSPGIDLLQRAYREPVGNSRMGELIVFHLRNNPATLALIGDDPMSAN
jgi:putative polysaccharide biosynthesis protein